MIFAEQTSELKSQKSLRRLLIFLRVLQDQNRAREEVLPAMRFPKERCVLMTIFFLFEC